MEGDVPCASSSIIEPDEDARREEVPLEEIPILEPGEFDGMTDLNILSQCE